MRYIGVCLGASTVKVVEMSRGNDGATVSSSVVRPHEGNPRKVLAEVLSEIGVTEGDRVVVTGRKFRNYVALPTITEPEAVERAFGFARSPGKHYDAIVSAGGETFMVYALDDSGRITSVHTGNKCASGTGEFFLQQIRRMSLSVEEAVQLFNSLWSGDDADILDLADSLVFEDLASCRGRAARSQHRVQ